MSYPPSTTSGSNRLVSLDALRGFAMFWILGMEELAISLKKASQAPSAHFISNQLEHVPWTGFHFLDLVFPLFMFVAGVSMVFSIDKSLERSGRSATVRKLAVRGLILYLLGVVYYDGMANGWETVRWVGVLQRIAIGGLAAGLAQVFLSLWGRIALAVGLLIAYWGAMTFIPVPGGTAGDFREGYNLANWIDFRFLPGRKWDGNYDPEGLLSTLPAIVSVLLGGFAGELLKRKNVEAWQKVKLLVGAGLILVILGGAWHPWFPVVKKLWSSSFVLVAGGWSCVLLGVFYALMDILQHRRWATLFIWIGMNPITLYLFYQFFPYLKIAKAIGGGPVETAFGHWGEVWLALIVVGLNALFAWFLYSRKLFLRV